MLKIQNILAPVDLSEHSRPAADHAVNLAHHFDAQVTFVHAIEPASYAYPPFEAGFASAAAVPPAKEIVQSLRKALDSFVEPLATNGRAETMVLQGDAASVIEEQARKRKADLIVMPTRGYGAFRRLVLGSVTTKVLNDVACPIFTGAHVETIPPHDPRPYRRIGVAIGLLHDHENILRWAADFSSGYGGKLLVVHGAPALEMATPTAQITPEIRNRVVIDAQESIAKLLKKLKIEAETYVAPSSAPDRVATEAVEAKHLDLLVIGRPHGDGVLGKLSAHAYDIIRHSPCPMVSV